VVLAVAVATAAAGQSDPVRPPNGEWVRSVTAETARIWAVGDADPPRSRRVARLIRRADPDRILYLGDVYPTGTLDDFRRWADPWRRLVRRMAPTPGNHEWASSSQGYEQFWRQVTGETPPTYYSFDAGGWEILSANGEHSETGAIVDWLRKKASAGGNCRLAFWHRPAYTAGPASVVKRSRRYWDALRGGTRMVLSGHEHNLQRLRPRRGIVQFISGASGRPDYDVDERDRHLAFGDDDHLGALRLRLKPGRAKWRFVSARGRVLDSGSLRCRA